MKIEYTKVDDTIEEKLDVKEIRIRFDGGDLILVLEQLKDGVILDKTEDER